MEDYAKVALEKWITSKQWDGVSRWGELMETVKTDDENKKESYIKQWMLFALDKVFSQGAFKVDACMLVLSAKEGAGKTRWLNMLFPTCIFPSVFFVEIKNFKKIIFSDPYYLKQRIIERLGHKVVNGVAYRQTIRRIYFAETTEKIQINQKFSERIFVLNVSDFFIRDDIEMQQVWAELFEIYKSLI